MTVQVRKVKQTWFASLWFMGEQRKMVGIDQGLRCARNGVCASSLKKKKKRGRAVLAAKCRRVFLNSHAVVLPRGHSR